MITTTTTKIIITAAHEAHLLLPNREMIIMKNAALLVTTTMIITKNGGFRPLLDEAILSIVIMIRNLTRNIPAAVIIRVAAVGKQVVVTAVAATTGTLATTHNIVDDRIKAATIHGTIGRKITETVIYNTLGNTIDNTIYSVMCNIMRHKVDNKIIKATIRRITGNRIGVTTIMSAICGKITSKPEPIEVMIG
jgi:hypothetical protein